VRKKTNFSKRVCIVNATDIALQEIKRGVPNTVMIGTLARVTGLVNLEVVERKIREMFERKLPEEMIQANIRALRRGYEEVQCSG
jgi:pyruvate ferredoxin oxidoreductase gamma subunit